MLIAQQKRKENIVEYILYLYQIENIIRAFELDMDQINENIVGNYRINSNTTADISEWYENLIRMMIKEGRQSSGHLQFLDNLVNDLHDFHLRLLQENIDPNYNSAYHSVIEILTELKSKNKNAATEVQAAIDGIYGYLILKIKKEEISAETKDAIKQLSNWLSLLSKHYHDFETGELQL